MHIKFVDLIRQNKILKKELFRHITSVILEADFNMGPRLKAFENEFASFCKKKYSVGVNSGTDALLLACMAYDISPGDEVITAPNSYFATAGILAHLKAIPVFVDIDPLSYTIDTTRIEARITKHTKAIIPVHLYGQSADMDPIQKLAQKYNLAIIEDACQAHGATYKGKPVPVSETGAFSFFPGKNLGCFGDGGAVVTNSKEIDEKIRYLRNDGSKEKYVHPYFGMKSRLDTLQASILSTKLQHLKSWNEKRKAHAALYTKLLKDIPGIKTPVRMPYADHVFHIYAIEYENRDGLRNHLLEKGIETIIHYPIPIHLQKAFSQSQYKPGDFPITERISKHVLSLPMFPELKDSEIKYIVNAVSNFVRK